MSEITGRYEIDRIFALRLSPPDDLVRESDLIARERAQIRVWEARPPPQFVYGHPNPKYEHSGQGATGTWIKHGTEEHMFVPSTQPLPKGATPSRRTDVIGHIKSNVIGSAKVAGKYAITHPQQSLKAAILITSMLEQRAHVNGPLTALDVTPEMLEKVHQGLEIGKEAHKLYQEKPNFRLEKLGMTPRHRQHRRRGVAYRR